MITVYYKTLKPVFRPQNAVVVKIKFSIFSSKRCLNSPLKEVLKIIFKLFSVTVTTVLLWFFSPCAPCDLVFPSCWLLIWFQVCLLSSLVTLSLKAPVLPVSVCRLLNVFPAVPTSPVFHVEWLKPLVLWTPCLLVLDSLTPGHCDRTTDQTNRPAVAEMEHLRRPRFVLVRRSRGISAAVRGSSSPLFAGNPPPFAVTSSPGPFVAHVSPPATASPPTEVHVHLGLLVAYEGMRWSPAQVPAPRQRPPVPAPQQRPPVPAPRQRPPVPAPRQRPPVPAPRQRPPVAAPRKLSPASPLVPSSSPSFPLVPSSSPSFPLVPSSSALPERPREIALPKRPWEIALPERPRDAALPELPRVIALPERPREIALPERPREIALPERPREIALPEHPRDAVPPKHRRESALPERPPVPAPSSSPEPLLVMSSSPEPLLAPSSSPEPLPAPSSSPEPLPVPSISPELLPVPSSSPEPLPVPSSSPEPLPVPSSSPEHLPAPSSSPEPLPVPSGSPERPPGMRKIPKKIFGGDYPPWPPMLPAPPWPPESPDPPWTPKIPDPPWPPVSPDPPWIPMLAAPSLPPDSPDPPWAPKLPDPPWPPEFPDPPWPPELHAPPWPPKLPAPPWPPELPDPPWPPEFPDPPWLPERAPPWRPPVLSCPVSVSREASRSPTPPPRWMVYGAGRTFREGGDMSRPWTVLLWFCSPCAPCDLVFPSCWLLIWFQVCLLSSLVTLSLKAPVLPVSVCRLLNVFPAVPTSLVFHVEWLKPLILWTPCLLVLDSLTPGHCDSNRIFLQLWTHLVSC